LLLAAADISRQRAQRERMGRGVGWWRKCEATRLSAAQLPENPHQLEQGDRRA
jgi:hypothetical protein